MSRHLSVVAALCAALGTGTASAAPVEYRDARRAKQALELHYIDEQIYFPVRCDIESGEIEELRTWLLCFPVGIAENMGGLYVAEYDENGELQIWAINGKAIQHIGGGTEIILQDENMYRIPAARWPGGILNIPSALELF
jgi:hypothetical protein